MSNPNPSPNPNPNPNHNPNQVIIEHVTDEDREDATVRAAIG